MYISPATVIQTRHLSAVLTEYSSVCEYCFHLKATLYHTEPGLPPALSEKIDITLNPELKQKLILPLRCSLT